MKKKIFDRKLTKIVATIGPVSDSEEMIKKMILSGVDVIRFNFKHADLEWHESRIKRVNQVAGQLGRHVGILIDLHGPEIRVSLPQDELEVTKGGLYLFGDVIFKEKKPGISVDPSYIIKTLKGGEKVFIEDGFFEFEVVKEEDKYYLLSKQDGIIKNKKNCNILGVDFPFSSLVEKDLMGLQMAVKNEVDFVALSFVRGPNDISILKEEMKRFKLNSKIIAKIETRLALKNIDKIVNLSDGIMVARGDLGVELSLEEVPYYQKLIIDKARKNNKFVITATQMLQSMVNSRLPTRAEVSDVANACYDKTDAVMLSGETANGKFPLESVKTMRRIILFNENKFDFGIDYSSFDLEEKEEIIAKTVVDLIKRQRNIKEKVDAIVVFTETGKTARLISANRPSVPIIAFVPEKRIADSLTINYGIFPIVYSENFNREIDLTSIKNAIRYLNKNYGFFGNNFLLIHGDFWRVRGKISTMRFFHWSSET